MGEVLQREFIYLWFYFTVIVQQIAPYYILGMVIGSTISVFGKGHIHRFFTTMLDKKLGVLGIIPASILGIVSPLCMYGTIPIASSFSEKGVKDEWLAAFMMSSILLNPQLIIYSGALGSTMLVVRIISCFLAGVVAGVLVHVFYKDKPFFNFSGFSEGRTRDVDPNLFYRWIKNIGRNIKASGMYFLVGLILSVLFQRYVPTPLVEKLFGNQKGLGVLISATVGVPLYACGGGTIPILMQWLDKGMSLGSATAFMLSGPATKITNLGALKIVLGAKHFLIYLAFIMVFAIASGLIVDFIF
ncbi:MAG: permease [Brevinema sp.]